MDLQILTIHKQVEQLLIRIYPTFRNYPKVEKTGLCLNIKNTFLSLLAALAQCSAVKGRRITYLQESQACVYALKTLMSLSKTLGYITIPFFEEIDLTLSEVMSSITKQFQTR